MLSTVRAVRFNEMEWSVPAARGADALREIKALIARREFPLMFPLEYRWVRGDDIWLSPNHGRDSVHISVHQYRGMPFEGYFEAVQAICLNHGGRPHWGKVHSLKACAAGAALSALGRLPCAARADGSAGAVLDAVFAGALWRLSL